MNKKWFTYAIIFYMLIAIGWWTLLLFKKNEAEFDAKRSLESESAYLETIQEEYKKQKMMILGESIFLGASLLAGIWIIFRSHQKELLSIEQQNNFLMSVSHELKTPVAAIDLAFQTIENRSLSHEQQKLLSKNAQQEVQRLKKMIDNLLLSTDSELLQIQQVEEFKISDCILELLQEISITHFKDHITFNSKLDKEPVVTYQKELFKKAIKNIIDNALKYGKFDGRAEVSIILEQDGLKSLALLLCDAGKGIPMHESKHIFKKFYRIGDESTREHGGTGIGLFLSKKIINNMNGEIAIINTNSAGACFKISIPTHD